MCLTRFAPNTKQYHGLSEAFSDLSPQVEKLAVTHVDAPEEAEELRQRLAEIYSGSIYLRETGPVIGAHVGPRRRGLAYL